MLFHRVQQTRTEIKIMFAGKGRNIFNHDSKYEFSNQFYSLPINKNGVVDKLMNDHEAGSCLKLTCLASIEMVPYIVLFGSEESLLLDLPFL